MSPLLQGPSERCLLRRAARPLLDVVLNHDCVAGVPCFLHPAFIWSFRDAGVMNNGLGGAALAARPPML